MISFLSAFPIRMERYSHFFRLKKIEIRSCPSVRVERKFLSSIDKRAWRFWPVLIGEGGDSVYDMISNVEPLHVRRKLKWGKVELDIKPLEIAFIFKYKGDDWYLSRDGTAWPANHPINEEFYGIPSLGFSVTVDDSVSLSLSIDIPVNRLDSDVLKLIEFVERAPSIRWPGKIEAVRLYRQGGADLASLYVRKDDGGFFSVIVDRERDLSGVAVAVSDLLDSGAIGKSGAVIDTSYEDKIIARDS
ncbi:hypothetical protein [Dethiosulfovibrio salsuginis]|uniref:Uncharacterized protein n=1 Tax=Dethiosulfovibrio salsuginis TaxID=561720 RepID=A0A1X7I777_9BACT|nr:hypothetical protein [Dethiosulfovibrio salsuginis]SMG09974.1 hypothetical protein SAMN06275492_101160 [Dethiosulfovibrio salsuginis]